MNADKKQIVQLVVLFGLLIGGVAFVSFQFVAPALKKHDSRVEKASKIKAQARTSEESAPTTPDMVIHSLFPGLNTPPERRDPFAAQLLPGAQLPDQPERFERPRKHASIPRVSIGKVPKIDIRPFNPFASSEHGVQPLAAQQRTPASDSDRRQEDEPKFVLTGVIRGSSNVAIIRSAQGGRYIVTQGQMINGRYRVLLVANDAVVLADGNRRIHLRLGGV